MLDEPLAEVAAGVAELLEAPLLEVAIGVPVPLEELLLDEPPLLIVADGVPVPLEELPLDEPLLEDELAPEFEKVKACQGTNTWLPEALVPELDVPLAEVAAGVDELLLEEPLPIVADGVPDALPKDEPEPELLVAAGVPVMLEDEPELELVVADGVLEAELPAPDEPLLEAPVIETTT